MNIYRFPKRKYCKFGGGGSVHIVLDTRASKNTLRSQGSPQNDQYQKVKCRSDKIKQDKNILISFTDEKVFTDIYLCIYVPQNYLGSVLSVA